MRFVIEMRAAGRHVIEADYFDIEEDGALVLRDHAKGRKVAAVAAGSWNSVRVQPEGEVAA